MVELKNAAADDQIVIAASREFLEQRRLFPARQ
jgi:hypothetical protein